MIVLIFMKALCQKEKCKLDMLGNHACLKWLERTQFSRNIRIFKVTYLWLHLNQRGAESIFGQLRKLKIQQRVCIILENSPNSLSVKTRLWQKISFTFTKYCKKISVMEVQGWSEEVRQLAEISSEVAKIAFSILNSFVLPQKWLFYFIKWSPAKIHFGLWFYIYLYVI